MYLWCYFLQVEVLHDFEAANSDELNLKRGDIVLVIPSETTADQVKTCGSFLSTFFFVSAFFSMFIINGNAIPNVVTFRNHGDFLSLYLVSFEAKWHSWLQLNF